MSAVYPSDELAVAELLSCAAGLHQAGFLPGHDGNLSLRVAPDALWITPAGLSKGRLTAADLVKLSLTGAVLSGTRRPSSETPLHLALYRADDTICGVVHAHPSCATTCAATGLSLSQPILLEAALLLGEVPCLPFALPGSPALGDAVAPYHASHRAVLLAAHGAVSWGRTLTQAALRMECLEQLACVQLRLRQANLSPCLTAEQAAALDSLRAPDF